MVKKKESKYNWVNHMRRKEKVQQIEQKKEESKKIGICGKCGGGGFRLHCEGGKLARICMNENCGDIQYH